MKKRTKILLSLSVIFILLGIAFIIGGFIRGANPIYIFRDEMFDYKVQEKRTSDVSKDGKYLISAEGISEISVEWKNGRIIVEPYAGSKILIKENSLDEFNEENALTYKKSGDTLKIKFSPFREGNAFSKTSDDGKTLHIYLPKNRNWEKVKINTVNSNIFVQKMKIAEVEIKEVSGEVFVNKMNLEKLKFNSVGGFLNIARTMAADIKITTTTGDVDAKLRKCPEKLYYDAVSGAAKFYIPVNSEFTVDITSLKGSFNSDFEGVYEKDRFIVGTGSAEFKVNETNGSVNIEKSAKKLHK